MKKVKINVEKELEGIKIYPYMTFEEMKKEFPDEYIAVGNPYMDNTKCIGGYVMMHGKDSLELAYKFRESKKFHNTFTTIYTGEIKRQPMRKWLRFKRLS